MVDFKKLTEKSSQVDCRDPIAIHRSLDSEVSHSHLRDVQREVLEELCTRWSQRDIVLKMSTGSGKTAVGLLMLKSYMAETRRPGVYLCPDYQLVEQVISEAKKLGLKAEVYKDTHPPTSTIRGDAVLVAVYNKLFNARSTFERDDVNLRPAAIVLDDAHTGVEKIRESFTITCRREAGKSKELYRFVKNLAIDSLKQQSLGKAESILMQDDYAVMEVPYWTWHTVLPQIAKRLARESESEALLYKWGSVRDDLYAMRCIISGSSFEISPNVINFKTIPAYQSADHRIFMSATLAEDSVLVLDLDCDPDAVLNPVTPQHDRGIGERMVLVPTLFDRRLDRQAVQEKLRYLSRNFNVVVLAPSYQQAKTWEDYGARAVIGKAVNKAVEGLRQRTHKFVAFANRYDGIDLPDDACRILVIDGLPRGDSLYDALERELSVTTHASVSRMVHRIEQGMGRAVRSPSDYAVVILLGNDIETFVARADVLRAMSKETQAQINLSHSLVKLTDEENKSPIHIIQDLATQCLKRDEGWKEFYRQEVVGFSSTFDRHSDLERRVRLAVAEREAFRHLSNGDYDRAGEMLVRGGDEYAKSDEEKARLFQRAAHYIHPKDKIRAQELQKKARDWNPKLLKPLKGVKYRKQSLVNINEADQILRWIRQFEHENAAIVGIRELRDRLRFENNSETFEEALKDLGQVLGALTERPERKYGGKGPDNLWLFPKIAYLIEAKNNSRADLIPKANGVEQLHDSREWGIRYYPELKRIPVICHRKERAVSESNPSRDMRVLTPLLLDRLLDDIENFIIRLTKLPTIDRNKKQVNLLLQKCGLTSENLAKGYTKPLQDK